MSEHVKKQQLIAEITAKFKDGMVLDAERMKVDRISYTTGEYDSIDSGWFPCLCMNGCNEVAIDYYDSHEPFSLTEQVGLQCSYGWPLNYIVMESLDSINQSMVKP